MHWYGLTVVAVVVGVGLQVLPQDRIRWLQVAVVELVPIYCLRLAA
jgi:hypothetical protein